MKTITTGNNNVFQTVVRKVVKEELETVEKRLDDKGNWRFSQLEDRFDALDNKMSKFRDEIMTGIDHIIGMFKKHDEEHLILNSDHKRLIEVEEKVETMEKIHPQGQHLAV